MRKLFLFVICFFIVLNIYAQNDAENLPRTFFDTVPPKKFYHKNFSLPESLKNKLRHNKSFSFEPCMNSKPEKFLYYGNNSKGFEVWQSIADHLYILKPDSTFVSNMPVLKTFPTDDDMVIKP